MAVLKTQAGSTEQSLLTFNSLANNANTLSGAITVTDASYLFADLTCAVKFVTTNPTVGTGISVWFLRSTDGGTTYEDGDATPTTPSRAPDVVFPVRAVTTAQRIIRQVALPSGTFKILLRNDNTGTNCDSASNALTMKAFTIQSV